MAAYNLPIFHLILRGVDRRWIFESDEEKYEILRRMGTTATEDGVGVLSYVIMSNHYHLIVRGEQHSISRFMQRVNLGFTRHYNKLHHRVGTLYESAYKRYFIRTELWIADRTRYTHLNPVAAGICAAPEEYEWSSIRAYLGTQTPPRWLEPDGVLGIFSKDPAIARRRYAEYVEAGLRGRPREKQDTEFADEPDPEIIATPAITLGA